MKRKKDVIKKAVLASVLAMSLNNVVWAAEGVDQPFSTVSELEALGGIASIDSRLALAMLRRAFMPVVMILFIIAVLSS